MNSLFSYLFTEFERVILGGVRDYFGAFLTPPGHFQPVLAMKFLVESEFRDQEPPRTQETTKTRTTRTTKTTRTMKTNL